MSEGMWLIGATQKGEDYLSPEYKFPGDVLNGAALGPLGKINIFVGANNSGKSRLMRMIMTNATYKIVGFPSVCRTSKQIQQLLLEYGSAYNDNLGFKIGSISKLEDFPGKVNQKILLKIKEENIFAKLDKISVSFESNILKVLNAIFSNEHDLWNRYPPNHRPSPIFFNTIKVKLAQNKIDISPASSWVQFMNAVISLLGLIKNLIDNDFIGVEAVSIEIGAKALNRYETKSRRTEILCELGIQLSKFMEESEKINEINKRCYIPTLRTLHSTFRKENERILSDFPKTTTKANYKGEISQDVGIFTGQSLYKEILKARNGTKNDRANLDRFESFLSQNFFQGKSVDLIASLHIKDQNSEMIDNRYVEINEFAQKEGDILIKIGDADEYSIQFVGDGIQALIMLTFPIFMAEEGTFIFIEEPELNLHPGMQRIFLEVLKKFSEDEKKNLTFFMTTHSNHFLDLTITEKAPVSIFTLRKNEEAKDGEAKFEIRNVHGGDKGILDLLGVQNSSVFIGNCSIWVEGHTDRKYIRKYLQELITANKLPNLTEDLHYVFFEYSGANLAHYRFGEATNEAEKHHTINGLRLNNAALVVGDNDQIEKSYLRRFQEIKESGFEYRILQQAKEIENLLKPAVLSKVLPRLDGYKTMLKGKEAQIAKLDHQSYVAFPLRNFIDNNFKQKKNQKPKVFDSGQKAGICDLAMKELTWASMSQEAQTLALDVYNFIATQNRMPKQSLPKKN
jgi:AAA15 family ATPase/GTPase